ncbi:MAG: PQQ-binding-like beta-propeller repeat protein, partial [bacterium]
GFAPGTYPLASPDPFSIYRTSAPGGNGPWGEVLAPSWSNTLFTDLGVTNGNYYAYSVEATDNRGHKSWNWDVVFLHATAPVITTTSGSGQVLVQWTPLPNAAAENIAAYTIYRSTFAGLAAIPMPDVEVAPGVYKRDASRSASSLLDTDGIANGTTYYYVVRAWSGITGRGRVSNESAATPNDIQPPGIPQNVAAVTGLDQTMLVSWTLSFTGGYPISGYWIYRTTQPGGSPLSQGSAVGFVFDPATSFLDQNAPATWGGAYRYSVVAVDTYVVPTQSGESVVPPAQGASPGYARFFRGDAYATGHSLVADGLSTSLGLRWALDVSGTVHCAPAVDVNGTVYVTAEDGRLHAVGQDGTEGGAANLSGMGFGSEASPAVAYTDGAGTVDRIYVGTRSTVLGGALLAFDVNGGMPWIASMTAAVRASPVVLPNGWVVAGDDNGIVRAFNRAGDLQWTATLTGPLRGAIIVRPERGEIVVISGLRLYGMRIVDGGVTGFLNYSSAPTGVILDAPRNALYLALSEGRLEGWNVAGGLPALLWSYTTGGLVGPPVLNQTMGVLGAVDVNGLAWGVNLVSPPVTPLDPSPFFGPSRSGVVSGLNGRYYAGTETGLMGELLPSGVRNSSYATAEGAGFGTSSPVLWKDANGRTVVYAGGRGHRLYAFVAAPAAPAGLTASAAGGTINLAWAPAGGGFFAVSGYRVFRATCATCVADAIFTSVGAAGTAYADSSVVPFQVYYYAVRAVDDGAFNNDSLPSPRVAIASEMSCAVAFTLVKTQIPANPGIGDTVTYRLIATNTGTATIQNVITTDTLSPVLVNVTTQQ